MAFVVFDYSASLFFSAFVLILTSFLASVVVGGASDRPTDHSSADRLIEYFIAAGLGYVARL